LQDFRNLRVWQLAHALTKDVYKVTQNFPKSEIYGLRSQLRRAAVSVPTNIVEGICRRTDRGTRAFLDIASGSAGEVEYLVLLSTEQGLIQEATAEHVLMPRIGEVRKMLNGFIKRLSPEADRRRRP
jgi:four helix bundle protein